MKQDARRFWVDPNGKRLIPVVGKVKWASIPVRSARADEPCAMGAAATTAPPASMNTAMTRSSASGAARRVMARAATIRPRRSTATAPAATSASGAVPPPPDPAASTARPDDMRSKGASHLSLLDCCCGESTKEEEEQHIDRMYIDELKLLLIHDPDAAALRSGERKIYGHTHRGEIPPPTTRDSMEASDARRSSPAPARS